MSSLPLFGSVLRLLKPIIEQFQTPRSDIRIERHANDLGSIKNEDRIVVVNWDFTALNDGRRDGHLAKPVLQHAEFTTAGGRTETVNPSEIGSGNVRLEYREKNENKVVALSNDKIRIMHKLPASKGIHDYVTNYSAMTFQYTVLVEDGSTPYEVEAEATLDIDGVSIEANHGQL
ncbi:hypothetical protein ACOZ4N_18110 [Halorientalis pallida]|uniref:hypothetical protein n=1 Tax=Halorientalis pallida TaxID=2479928 RepID=UPI003C6F0FC5